MSEYQVKAAFLYNFAKFTEWPPGAFPNESAPIIFCIFGDDPFGSAFDEVIRGKAINNRQLIIRRTRKASDLPACQIVFVSTTRNQGLSEIFQILRGSSALLVGESQVFAERGGQIQFVLENEKVRFYVNTDATERAHLKLSSKLLALAKIVHDGNRPR